MGNCSLQGLEKRDRSWTVNSSNPECDRLTPGIVLYDQARLIVTAM
ncbi:MAG: hypothetical protein QNJ32_00925 [Xenococcaceae cyanobacterium MO_167.B27]|nr:hypothetical protein [Xenococcaceae cyanobacterium MO_167.B27]